MPSRSSPQPFAALEPRVHHVSAAAIRKKWKKLPPASQEHIRDLVSSLEKQCVETRKKKVPDTIVEECVQQVAQRLIERLPRMPFPPSCDEQHFDFEATLRRVQAMEEQLTCNVHSTNLLRAQIAKEERMLADDKSELERLERGLKSSHSLRRQQEKAIHPVARNLEIFNNQAGVNVETGFGGTTRSEKCFATDTESDADLSPMLKQLRNHLESMENNISGLRPLSEAMDNTRQEVLMLSSQYAKIS